MRILLTNDDGINAPGLEVLLEIATEVAGPSGEIWVVAPAFEQSGVGHCISYTHPTMVVEQGPRRFAAEGSPADCVLAALYDVMAEAKPDLVLSGVNRGNNSGENALYSGTLGGAIEATLQGVPAIALSQFMGPRTRDLESAFDSARRHGPAVIRALLEKADWETGADYGLFYSVNFPPCSAEQTKGMQVVPQGRRPGVNFAMEPHLSPSGRRFLWIKGGAQDIASAPGTDVAVNLQDYISVTPMRCDLTAHDRLADLAARLA